MKNIFKRYSINAKICKELLSDDFQKKITILNNNLEQKHNGELLIIIEKDISFLDIITDISVEEKGLKLFSNYRVWDTNRNTGILLYISIGRHHFEIIADRGINKKVGKKQWNIICDKAIIEFKKQNWQSAVIESINSIGKQLIKHFPDNRKYKSEISDKPIII